LYYRSPNIHRKKLKKIIKKTYAQTCKTTKLTNKLANVFQTACRELITRRHQYQTYIATSTPLSKTATFVFKKTLSDDGETPAETQYVKLAHREDDKSTF